MIGKTYKRAKEGTDTVFLGRILFDDGDIKSFATVKAFCEFPFGKVTGGVEYFISLDGKSDGLLWKILQVIELSLEDEENPQGIYKFRLTMDKLPG